MSITFGYKQWPIHDGEALDMFGVTKALVDSQPAADEASVEEPQAVRESMLLSLGPGRPFAADSFVILFYFSTVSTPLLAPNFPGSGVRTAIGIMASGHSPAPVIGYRSRTLGSGQATVVPMFVWGLTESNILPIWAIGNYFEPLVFASKK